MISLKLRAVYHRSRGIDTKLVLLPFDFAERGGPAPRWEVTFSPSPRGVHDLPDQAARKRSVRTKSVVALGINVVAINCR